jgi:hypothetical protein
VTAAALLLLLLLLLPCTDAATPGITRPKADLLVCDANDNVQSLGAFLGPVLPRLKPHGWLILTLKFYGRGLKNDSVVEKMAQVFPVRACISQCAPAACCASTRVRHQSHQHQSPRAGLW